MSLLNRFDQDYDLVFEGIDLITAELAQSVLFEQGIRSMLHTRDFQGNATMGLAPMGVQLLVPRGSRDEARRILESAWGETGVAKLTMRHDLGSIPATPPE